MNLYQQNSNSFEFYKIHRSSGNTLKSNDNKLDANQKLILLVQEIISDVWTYIQLSWKIIKAYAKEGQDLNQKTDIHRKPKHTTHTYVLPFVKFARIHTKQRSNTIFVNICTNVNINEL